MPNTPSSSSCSSRGAGGHAKAFVTVPGSGGARCAKRSNAIEARFYADANAAHAPLLASMPRFYGLQRAGERPSAPPRLVIENIKHSMHRPRIMDVKLGRYTSYLDELMDAGQGAVAAMAKVARMRAYDTLNASTSTLSYRIVGSTSDGGRLSALEKLLTPPDDQLRDFFASDPGGHAAAAIARGLAALGEQLARMPRLVLVGASVLLVYDEARPTSARVALVDFAHSRLRGADRSHESRGFAAAGARNLERAVAGIARAGARAPMTIPETPQGPRRLSRTPASTAPPRRRPRSSPLPKK
jgi:hypothetical protein